MSTKNEKINLLKGSNIDQIMQILKWHEDRLNYYNDKIVDILSSVKSLNENIVSLQQRIDSHEILITETKKKLQSN